MKWLNYLYNPLIILSIVFIGSSIYFLIMRGEMGIATFIGTMLLVWLSWPPLVINWLINLFVKKPKTALILKWIAASLIHAFLYLYLFTQSI